MKWTVVWTQDAENELADLWQQANDRASITRAAHRIEQNLKHRPMEIGEEFYGDWIVQDGPLPWPFRSIRKIDWFESSKP